MVSKVSTSQPRPNSSKSFFQLLKKAWAPFSFHSHDNISSKERESAVTLDSMLPHNEERKPQRGRFRVTGERMVEGEVEYVTEFDPEALTMSDELAEALLRHKDFQSLVATHRPDKVPEVSRPERR